MAIPPKEKLPEARARLMSLASASRPPRILDVLTSLRSELLLCIEAGHPAAAVLAALRAAGYQYSKSAFLEAWKAFRDGEGLTLPKPVIYTPAQPRGTIQRQRGASAASAAAAPKPVHPRVLTPGTRPPPGSALEALARPSVADLLSPRSSS